jgi:hypothetical protein
MRICIRTRVMRLMSDRAYAYAYGRLYIYGPLALEIDQSSQSTSQRSIQSNNMPYATNSVTCKIDDPEHARHNRLSLQNVLAKTKTKNGGITQQPR